GEGRAHAAAALGLDRHQEPELPGHALRRHADRPRHGEHHAAGDDGCVPRARHAEAGRGRAGPRWRAAHPRGAEAGRHLARRRDGRAGGGRREAVRRCVRQAVRDHQEPQRGDARAAARRVLSERRGMPDQPPPATRVLAVPPRREAHPPGPCAMVIFGAGGDLTKRLLIPALFNLARTGLIPDNFAIVGVDIAERTVEDWRASLLDMLKGFVGNPASESHVEQVDPTSWDRLTAHMSYVQGDLNDPGLYDKLGEHLEAIAGRNGTAGNVLFYLAISDRFFSTVVDNLGRAGLAHQDGHRWRRVVIEKPFGHSLESAKDLNARILKVLDESQIYRIDHFLGKETVQNIMAFRFANGLFEPIWNRDRIDHVQITAAETIGVEHRGRFYERTGALRDMVPNHVFQLLAMV